MSNPLFDRYGQHAQPQQMQQGRPGDAVTRFQQAYGCRPSEYLHQMLTSGRMPQNFYNQALPQARRFAGMNFR